MTKIKPLKLNKICRNFTYREIAVLAQFVKEESFKASKVIFEEGQSGDKIYMIISGQVGVKSEVLGKNGDFLTQFGPGEFMGELSLFEAGPRRVTAVAITDDTILFSINKSDFNQLCANEPFVSYKMIREMLEIFSQKLKDSSDDLTELLSIRGSGKN